MKRLRRQAGLSLIELLVALAIGAVLTLGVFSVFISGIESNRVETALSRLQQSGRAGIDLITRDIRQAGYAGCNSVDDLPAVAASNLQVQRVLAYTGTGSALNPSTAGTDVADVIKGVARAGSDVLVVDYGDFFGDDLFDATTVFNALGQQFTLNGADDNECRLTVGSLLLMSNCITTHVFRVSDADPATAVCNGSNAKTLDITVANNGGPGAASGFAYEELTDVAEYLQFIWYVADTGRDLNGENVYALFRRDASELASEEMIEGVEYMKIEVGERVGNNIRYVPPGAGITWENVESVRIALLVQSFEEVLDAADTSTYTLLSTSIGTSGANQHGGGKVLRNVYTTTQAVRNTSYGS